MSRKTKKIVFSLVSALAVCSLGWAGENEQYLLHSKIMGLKHNLRKIKTDKQALIDLSKNVDLAGRVMIYDSNKSVSPAIGCLLNMVPGGWGSFIMGDTISGVIYLVGDVLGLGMFYLGRYPGTQNLTPLGITGMSLVITVQISSYISPWFYSAQWNQHLKEALLLEGSAYNNAMPSTFCYLEKSQQYPVVKLPLIFTTF